MNKSHYRLLPVVSESLTLGEKGLGLQKKRGQALIKLTEISTVEKHDTEEYVRIIMKNASSYIVKKIDLGDLLKVLDRTLG